MTLRIKQNTPHAHELPSPWFDRCRIRLLKLLDTILTDSGGQASEMQRRLGVPKADLDQALAVMMEAGALERDERGYRPRPWHNRQFEDDLLQRAMTAFEERSSLAEDEAKGEAPEGAAAAITLATEGAPTVRGERGWWKTLLMKQVVAELAPRRRRRTWPQFTFKELVDITGVAPEWLGEVIAMLITCGAVESVDHDCGTTIYRAVDMPKGWPDFTALDGEAAEIVAGCFHREHASSQAHQALMDGPREFGEVKWGEGPDAAH